MIRQRARLLLKRRQNERRMRLMERAVQAAATGITILDARSSEYSVAYANPAFSKMTGYAANELHGKNLRILKGPDTDVAAMTELRDAFAAGRDCRVLLKNYRKDGTSFQNDLIAAPMPDQAGRLTHYVAVQYDLTQRLKEHVADKETDIDEMVTARTRELEATATHVEERRRFVETILNSMVSAIVVSDASGVISFANRSALSTLGTSMADCIGRSVPELFGHHEGVVEIVSHTAPARAEYRLDFPFISPGGARLYIGMSVSPVPEEFRAELGYIFLFRDLAETLKDETDPRLLWAQSREGPPAEPGSVAGAEVQKDGADKVPLAEPPVARRRVHLALSFCSPVDLVRAALTGLAGSFAEIETLVKVEAPQELPEGLLDRAQMVEALTHLIGHAVERSGKPEQVHIHIDCERTGALHAPAVRVDVVFPKLAQITERDMSEGAPAEQRSAFRLTDFTSAQRLIEANGGRLLRPPRDGDEQMLSVIMPAAG
ncbi:MAG: PAS domain-containing protein [Vicinamibacteria bacterium]|nr:PAS domain-containing protein [Vicinamibacteria bacterium]